MVIFFSLFGFILGIILGSFIKAIADRSLSNQSFWGRSSCPKCQTKLKWHDLIPLFSYIVLQGKCRYCHKKISIEYLVVEVVMGLLIGFLFFQQFSINYQLLISLAELIFKIFFITVLAILFLTDLRAMLIPDRVILPAIGISIIFITVITIIKVAYLYTSLKGHPIGQFLLPGYSSYFIRHAFWAAQPLWGGILTGLAIFLFFLALIIVTRGKGMGGGDVKLGAFLGLGLGFPAGVLAIVLSFLMGAILSLIAIFLGKKRFGDHLPFGPFLVIGSLTSLFWGDLIINSYLKMSMGS